MEINTLLIEGDTLEMLAQSWFHSGYLFQSSDVFSLKSLLLEQAEIDNQKEQQRAKSTITLVN